MKEGWILPIFRFYSLKSERPELNMTNVNSIKYK